MVDPNRMVSLEVVALFHILLLCVPHLINKSKKRKYRLGNLIRSFKVSNAGKGTSASAQVNINSVRQKQTVITEIAYDRSNVHEMNLLLKASFIAA
jgi:hypothetical protein